MKGVLYRQSPSAKPIGSAPTLRRHYRSLRRVFVLIAFLILPFQTSLAFGADAIDREQAIALALEQNGGDGKVLGVSIVQDDANTEQFAVKLLSNGRIRIIRINKAP